MDVAIVLAGRGEVFHYSPLKLAEYLAAGRADRRARTSRRSRPRIQDDGTDAVLVAPGDHEALAGAIAQLHDEPEMRCAIARGWSRRAAARSLLLGRRGAPDRQPKLEAQLLSSPYSVRDRPTADDRARIVRVWRCVDISPVRSPRTTPTGWSSRREALRRLGLLGLGLTSATDHPRRLRRGRRRWRVIELVEREARRSPRGPTPVGRIPTGARARRRRHTGAPVTAEPVTFDSPVGALQAAVAIPAAPKGAVLVVHENRGLTPHFFDLVGRLATDGYAALCVDLLSSAGGTGSLTDEAAVQAALGERRHGDAPRDPECRHRRAASCASPGAKIGVVGFCFGGGMTWNLLQRGRGAARGGRPVLRARPGDAGLQQAPKAAVLAIYAGQRRPRQRHPGEGSGRAGARPG